jgi:N-acylglucosamine 2-epimerase
VEAENLLTKYERELVERVLPFWLRHALDPVHGGYFNCLDRHGRVYDPRKHVWMQGRGAWMLSRMYLEWEPRAEYKAAADAIFSFLHKYARSQEPRCWFSLTEDGRPAAFQRKPYAAFFVAMAFLEYSKISGNPVHRAEAADLFWQMHQWIRSPELLGRAVLPGGLAYSQLADIYVTAWLALELDTVEPDPRYGKVIGECMERLAVHYDAHQRVFVENAAPENPAFRRYPEGRLVCTGSSLEVSWLFLHVLKRFPDASFERTLYEAIEGALEFGWDKEFGGLYYFQDIEDRPAIALESNMKLWWPHTEALYACALAYRNTGESKFLRWWKQLDEYAFRTFSDAEDGEWFGYCDRRGQLASTLKGGPYKGIFHVPRFLLFTLQAYGRRSNHAEP